MEGAGGAVCRAGGVQAASTMATPSVRIFRSIYGQQTVTGPVGITEPVGSPPVGTQEPERLPGVTATDAPGPSN